MINLKLLDQGFIPDGGYYSSHDWYISIAGVLEKTLRVRNGRREVQDFIDIDPFHPSATEITALTEAVKDQIDVLFIVNDESYARIYRALTEEYNPIWNVDGTETMKYVRDNTGTQSNKIDHTGTQGNLVNNTGTQTNKVENRGTQTNAQVNTGTQTMNTTNTGTQTTTDATGNTSTDYKTTYDSAVEQETGKTISQNSGSNTRSDNLTENATRTDALNQTDTRTDNLTETGTRTDNLQESATRTDNLTDDGLRTDNLKEEYKETRTRQGNIGVIDSASLVEKELRVRLSYKFMEIVEQDILKVICYSC